MSLHLSVSHSVQSGGGVPGQESPRAGTPPWAGTPPPATVYTGIRSKSGRYASHWNAFLFYLQTSGKITIGKPSEEVFEREKKYGAHNYGPLPVALSKGGTSSVCRLP